MQDGRAPQGTTETFEELQRGFLERLKGESFAGLEHGTMVVCPSITFDGIELRKITGIEFYEERLLCFLLMLENPELEIVYLTCVSVDPVIVDYYLSFLSDPEGARRRLRLVSLEDPAARALTEKLLELPDLLAELGGSLDPATSFLVCFLVGDLEKDLACRLGIPIFGPPPELWSLGSKSSARSAARDAGVPVLEGAEDIFDEGALEDALAKLAARGVGRAVIKLNYGFSGQGNVIVPVGDLCRPLTQSPAAFCAEGESWESYLPKIEKEGAIVEELLATEGVVSPSVQIKISPAGEIEVVSTHDQILGGPDGQVYLGCRFPARNEYRSLIQDHALAVSEVLAAEGVIGSFGMDFVVAPDATEAFLSEINLRMGGTTHPFLMVRGATGATYDVTTGELLSGDDPLFYIATDNFKSQGYVGFHPTDVIEAVEESGLAFERGGREGVMLHLLGALPGYGKLGATCVGPGRVEADEIYARLTALLEELVGKRSLGEPSGPTA